MIRLVTAELRRFSHRWLILAGLAILVLSQALIFANVFSSTAPPSAAQVANAQAQLDDINRLDAEYYGPDGQCMKEQEAAGPDADFGCDDQGVALTIDDFLKHAATYADVATPSMVFSAITLLIAALIISISFMTADLSSGAMSNWLTFEPRRMRVYSSKLTALLLALVAAGIVVVGSNLGIVYAIARYNGALEANASTLANDALKTGLRALVLLVLFVLIGYGIATLARHAAIAMGAVLMWTVADLYATHAIRSGWRFATTPRLYAWLNGKWEFEAYEVCTNFDAMNGCTPKLYHVYQGESLIYLAVLAVVVAVAGAIVFQRRDAA
ncbi:ABC transporter permease subunit [Rarobacter incanus]|uniref:ABC-2 type transport system permease protein n=1 Tax=Rarobacter incanus TaxID=153494 RepID=A0A542SQH3_9MICO|nr:ABC transporter permease subunit [Rarobacter incanus]TQK76860.1 hypothetical protein FB389_1555 [Rarobacter incanus]